MGTGQAGDKADTDMSTWVSHLGAALDGTDSTKSKAAAAGKAWSSVEPGSIKVAKLCSKKQSCCPRWSRYPGYLSVQPWLSWLRNGSNNGSAAAGLAALAFFNSYNGRWYQHSWIKF